MQTSQVHNILHASRSLALPAVPGFRSLQPAFTQDSTARFPSSRPLGRRAVILCAGGENVRKPGPRCDRSRRQRGLDPIIRKRAVKIVVDNKKEETNRQLSWAQLSYGSSGRLLTGSQVVYISFFSFIISAQAAASVGQIMKDRNVNAVDPDRRPLAKAAASSQEKKTDSCDSSLLARPRLEEKSRTSFQPLVYEELRRQRLRPFLFCLLKSSSWGWKEDVLDLEVEDQKLERLR